MSRIQEPSTDYLEPLTIDDSNPHPAEEVRQLWETEYGRKSTIPSSRRVSPAHALVQLVENYKLSANTALDLGCGNGRNAFYLAARGINVTAIDFSQTALDLLEAEKNRQSAPAAVSSINHDIRKGLPLSSSSMDLVLDSYCLCHFINDSERRNAIEEVYRVLKPGGKLLKIHLDNSDEYYLERRRDRTDYGHTSYDSANGLFKIHMSLDAYIQDIGLDFELIRHEKVIFTDEVKGAKYERSAFICVVQKLSA